MAARVVTREDQTEWMKFYGGLHKDAVAGASALAATLSDTGIDDESGEEFLGAAAKAMSVQFPETYGGLRVTIHELRVRDGKKLLSQLVGSATNKSDEEAGLEVVEVIEGMILDKLEFEDGQKPANVREWFEDLELTEGLFLSAAFAQKVNIEKLMEAVNAISGKVRSVRAVKQALAVAV